MRAALAAAVAALALGVSASGAWGATAISSNWSGYTVTGTTYSNVDGSWTQPAASCSSSGAATSASAFWVGLGGETDNSNALEQIGTDEDCMAGRARYTAWYELVPKASVRIALKLSAGDRLAASVAVKGTSVRVSLANLTTGKAFTKTLRMASPDVSSAEWIAEAPSAVTPGGTFVLPLADFGSVRFTKAIAMSTSGHAGTIADHAWTETRIELVGRGGPGGPGGPPGFGPLAAADAATGALPGALAASGSAFTVTFRDSTAAAPAGV
jgi:hypothetical protein